MRHSVCAITITFNPNLEVFTRQLESLAPQCEVILVDNGSIDEVLTQIEALSERFGCTLLQLGSNKGIASAQNHGVSFVQAKRRDCEYVLFLDHDSVPGEGFVDAMENEFKQLRAENPKIGVLGPAIYEPRAKVYYGYHVLQGLRYRRISPMGDHRQAIRCTTINSAGTFCPLAVMQTVGQFADELFIDHVETDWCFRATAAGYELFGSNTVTLEHRMGDDVLTVNLFGKSITLPYRSPHRHRYLMRNSITMLRRSYVPRVWKAYCIAKIAITMLLFGTVSDDPKAQRSGILSGINDGMRKRSGEIARG